MERFYNDGGGSSDSSSYPELHYNSSSPAALDAPGNTGRNGGVKYCGVCGDVAKSYHFGGLSCDSCKAFFRRSVQNDNYLHFQCCHRGQCTISLSNRKSCQFCRMKRCFGIGMEKSWVMTEEERKALMKARAEKKSCKKTSISSSSSSSLSAASPHNQNSSSSSGGDQSPGMASTSAAPANEYEPQIERMIDFLSPLEIKEIESIVTKYMHAYQHVPYRTELRFYDSDRPGVQVMEVRISTSIYRWSGGKPNLGMRFTEFFCLFLLFWRGSIDVWDVDPPIRLLRPSDGRFFQSAFSRSKYPSQRRCAGNVSAAWRVGFWPADQLLAQRQHVHVQRRASPQAGQHWPLDVDPSLSDASRFHIVHSANVRGRADHHVAGLNRFVHTGKGRSHPFWMDRKVSGLLYFIAGTLFELAFRPGQSQVHVWENVDQVEWFEGA